MSVTLFSGYLRLEAETEDGLHPVLAGPGHDVAVVSCVLFLPDGGPPRFAVKRGDTRPARVLRNLPYVKHGLVAGRLDHEGVDARGIAAAEVAEEIGAELLGPPEPLGAPMATMATASTERDLPFWVPIRITEGSRPSGDGWGQELPELLGYDLWTMDQVLEAIRSGEIGEAARARVVFGRAFEKLGLISLGSSEDPTCGLGPVTRMRPEWLAPTPPGLSSPAPELQVDGARFDVEQERPVRDPAGRFLVGQGFHLSGGREVAPPYPQQIIDLEEDEVEVLPYAGSGAGLQVGLRTAPTPRGLAARVAALGGPQPVFRSGLSGSTPRGSADAVAARLAREAGLGPPEPLLVSEASPGQSTLCEHLYAAPAGAADGLRPLAEALRLLRRDGGRARTEAAILEMAVRKGGA